MSNVYTAIIDSMRHDYKKVIAEADANLENWYELFVSEGEDVGTHTVRSGSTFDEVAVHYEEYATKYGVDRTYMDIWKPNGTDGNEIEHGLYHEHNVYAAIRDHLKSTGGILKLRMVGEYTRNENGGIRYIKDHCGEGTYFYDGIARTYFKDRVFYIPEHSGSDGKFESRVIVTKRFKCASSLYTVSHILEMCDGDEALANHIMDAVAWADPSTELEQIRASDNKLDSGQLVKDGWLCTYPDTGQWGRKVDEFTWKYFDNNDGPDAAERIDIRDYTDKQIEDAIQPFGYTLALDLPNNIKTIYGDSYIQIIAECIFEMEV